MEVKEDEGELKEMFREEWEKGLNRGLKTVLAQGHWKGARALAAGAAMISIHTLPTCHEVTGENAMALEHEHKGIGRDPRHQEKKKNLKKNQVQAQGHW